MIDYLMIGEVLKPQGIKGECKIKPYAANHDDFRRWKTLYVKQGESYAPIKARCSRVHDGFAYVTLGECASMEDAEKLRGTQLYIDRAHANHLEEDEVYISDLIGCEGIDEEGKSIGVLTEVLQHGVVDVYVFKARGSGVMAPALKAVFPTVDVAAKRIAVVREKLEEVAVWED
ncbi:MAG: 16S rRNA processing protein RimM [Clostridia bacterium]|nr:16S rRNA processing protein RimM [Clostridia bacterium]